MTGPRLRVPIRMKLMGLLLTAALVPAVLVGVLSLQALNQVVDTTSKAGVAALEREATSRLDGLAQQSAARLDASFEQARAEATALARYSGFLFSHPEYYGTGADLSGIPAGGAGLPEVAPLAPQPIPSDTGADGLRAYGLAGRLHRQGEGFWVNDRREPVGVFMPDGRDLDQARRELALTSHLDSWLTSTQGVNPFRLDAYVMLRDGLTRLYPNWGLPADIGSSFDPTGGSYYVLATPANNPDRRTVWTPPYDDPAGMGRMVTASAPIYSERGEFLGVASVDVLLADVMKSLQGVNTGASGYAFLLDSTGRVVAAPNQALQDLSLPPVPVASGGDVDLNLRQSDNSDVRQLIPDLTSGDRAGVRELTLGGASKYLAFAPLRRTGWTLVLVEPTSDVLSSATQVVADIEVARAGLWSKLKVILLLVLGLVVLASLAAGAAVTNPLERLSAGVRALAGGRLEQPIQLESDDEIGELASEFNHMAAQLTQLNAGLERKVEERTAELARKADQLRALNEASRQIAAVLDPDELLRTLAGLVADTFGYARTAIFLAASDGGSMVLGAAVRRGPTAAARLSPAALEPSGAVSGAVVRAADLATPVLVSGERSELAVPIRLAERILGVLHVEADGPGAFNEEDLFTLSALADQLAVGLENARLFAEERERRREARDLAIAEERNRMAREIHDTLAQGFMGILLQLQAAEAELGPGQEELARRLTRAADLARDSLQEARRSVWNLRPQRLERASLPEALRQEAGALGAVGGAALVFRLEGEERPLAPTVEAALLRVAQEALSNIRKHAEATEVALTLRYRPEGVELVIADNGSGFDVDKALARSAPAPDRGGFGLRSMRERVEALGGTLQVRSYQRAGTTVQVWVPAR